MFLGEVVRMLYRHEATALAPGTARHVQSGFSRIRGPGSREIAFDGLVLLMSVADRPSGKSGCPRTLASRVLSRRE